VGHAACRSPTPQNMPHRVPGGGISSSFLYPGCRGTAGNRAPNRARSALFVPTAGLNLPGAREPRFRLPIYIGGETRNETAVLATVAIPGPSPTAARGPTGADLGADPGVQQDILPPTRRSRPLGRFVSDFSPL
jgi:hypothetical protein